MQKKFGDDVRNIQVDPINGDYYLSIPEWIINEFSWYEDTEIKFNVEGGEIILTENTDD